MSTAAPRVETLKFNLGDKHVIALQYGEGKQVHSDYSGDQLMYTLTDGRRMYVDPYVGERIRELRLGPSEPFEIGKLERFQGNRRTVEIDVRRLDRRAAAVAQTTAPTTGQTSHPTPPPPPKPPQSASPMMNGDGETAGQVMARCYKEAVDVALAAMAYAREQGLMLSPTYEDIRTSGTALFIQSSGGRR